MWIAPSTPPPPASSLFAALTMASAVNRLMSPRVMARTRYPILVSATISEILRHRLGQGGPPAGDPRGIGYSLLTIERTRIDEP
jgi:hypothetical protein